MNSAALTRMSTALSTWRSAVKRMIDKGDSYEKIKAKYPLMSEDEYKEFKIKCESSATSESSQWGKEMRELNLGEQKLGPGGYRVAEPIWDKEDAERAEQGLPPRFKKYSGDKQTRNFVRARYKEDPKQRSLPRIRRPGRLSLFWRRRLKAVAQGRLRAPLLGTTL